MNSSQEHGRSSSDIHAEAPHTPTRGESAAVDARQGLIMEVASPDGRSPTHNQRRAGWKWFVIVGVCAVLCGIAWAVLRGVSAAAVLGFGALGVVLMVLGGWPVLIASFQRGREEKQARNDARSQPNPESPTPGKRGG